MDDIQHVDGFVGEPIQEVRGVVVRVRHDDTCDGWICHELVTQRIKDHDGGPRVGAAVPTYRPCEICKPGQHAIWEQGATARFGVAGREAALIAYVDAEQRAGHRVAAGLLQRVAKIQRAQDRTGARDPSGVAD